VALKLCSSTSAFKCSSSALTSAFRSTDVREPTAATTQSVTRAPPMIAMNKRMMFRVRTAPQRCNVRAEVDG